MSDLGEVDFFGWKFRGTVDYSDGCKIIYESVGPVPHEVGEAFRFQVEQIRQALFRMARVGGEEVGKDATAATEASGRTGDGGAE